MSKYGYGYQTTQEGESTWKHIRSVILTKTGESYFLDATQKLGVFLIILMTTVFSIKHPMPN